MTYFGDRASYKPHQLDERSGKAILANVAEAIADIDLPDHADACIGVLAGIMQDIVTDGPDNVAERLLMLARMMRR